MRVNWREEEIRLLLTYYKRMRSGDMHKDHPQVLEASKAIRSLEINKEYSYQSEKFRNPNGVALKLANFLFLDPTYEGKGMKGCSALDRKIFNEENMERNLKLVVQSFLELLPQLGEKGAGIGKNNAFNGLANKLNVSYAGSNIKKPEDCFENTSPIISFGLGRFTHVPWIVFTNHSQELMNGIYPVLLFYTEQKKIVLSYGISESNTPQVSWKKDYIEELSKVAVLIPETDKYRSSYVYKVYEYHNSVHEIEVDQIVIDLEKVITDFHKQMKREKNKLTKPVITNNICLKTFAKDNRLSVADAHIEIQKMLTQGSIIKQSTNLYSLKQACEAINIDKKKYHESFPYKLISWGANKKSAVRIPFNTDSGRPAGKVIKNKLTHTIDSWLKDHDGISNIIFIGGPGNGKTDSLEYIINQLINRYSLGNDIRDTLSQMVIENYRKLEVDIVGTSNCPFKKIIAVPEATTGSKTLSKEEALLNDFETYLDDPEVLYISCINRGVLDDLKSFASIKSKDKIVKLINNITSSTNGEGVETWPMLTNSKIGIWFMDIESLFDIILDPNPSNQIMHILKLQSNWKWYEGQKELMLNCPFYDNFVQISNNEFLLNFNLILNNYELISESRLNFRNYFSLVSSLFAGNNGDTTDPVAFSVTHSNNINISIPAELNYVKSCILLSFSSYPLRLFRDWENTLRSFSSIKEKIPLNNLPLLKNLFEAFLDTDVESNLCSFQSEYEKRFTEKLVECLDPFHSNHERIINITETFSISISDGYDLVEEDLSFVQKKFIQYLILIEEEIRRKQVESDTKSIYDQVINELKVFSSKICCRIIGTKFGLTKDLNFTEEYSKLLIDFKSNRNLLNSMFKKITKSKTVFPLHSFGQPKPDIRNSIIIKSDSAIGRFNIKELNQSLKRPTQRGVFFEHPNKDFIIPLSYNLYKALSQINYNIDKNSINPNINALIERMESLLYSKTLRTNNNYYDDLTLTLGEKENLNIASLNNLI